MNSKWKSYDIDIYVYSHSITLNAFFYHHLCLSSCHPKYKMNLYYNINNNRFRSCIDTNVTGLRKDPTSIRIRLISNKTLI